MTLHVRTPLVPLATHPGIILTVLAADGLTISAAAAGLVRRSAIKEPCHPAFHDVICPLRGAAETEAHALVRGADREPLELSDIGSFLHRFAELLRWEVPQGEVSYFVLCNPLTRPKEHLLLVPMPEPGKVALITECQHTSRWQKGAMFPVRRKVV